MRIGLLTGGGDAPGLNTVIESVGTTLLRAGCEIIGICDGFEGIFENQVRNLKAADLEGLHARAGTLLGTTNRCGTEGREKEFLEKYRQLRLDGMVVAGGDGTFRGLSKFVDSIPVIGVPKTIDNDLSGTDVSFGFDTACSVVAESVDALRATAEAHSRILIVETMGRTAGWIALGGGLASLAEVILVPERPFDFKQLCEFLSKKKTEGHRGLLMVVAEGAHERGESAKVAFQVKKSPQPERLGGVAELLARKIEGVLPWEGRHVVLGHLQRSRSPTSSDRLLAIQLGVRAAELVLEKNWGKAVVVRQGSVAVAPVSDIMGPPRRVDSNHQWVRLAQSLGIFI